MGIIDLNDFKPCVPDNNIMGNEGTPERKQWFLDRVGKEIFKCRYVFSKNSFYVSSFLLKDNTHAKNCFDAEYMYPAYNGYLYYFNTREDAVKFGMGLKKSE